MTKITLSAIFIILFGIQSIQAQDSLFVALNTEEKNTLWNDFTYDMGNM